MTISFFCLAAFVEIFTLSLHDALPIWLRCSSSGRWSHAAGARAYRCRAAARSARGRSTLDRKSTRLNSSHLGISYAVFCLKKKKKIMRQMLTQSKTASQYLTNDHIKEI